MGEEMVSFKKWSWEALKIKFPCGFGFAIGFLKAKLIRDSRRVITSYSKEFLKLLTSKHLA